MNTAPADLPERQVTMDFARRVTTLLKAAGLTQRPLAVRRVRAVALRIHLAALDQRDTGKHASIRALIEGALLRHQARRPSAS